MPRPSKGARLYWENGRGWVIRDGPRKIRAGTKRGRGSSRPRNVCCQDKAEAGSA
jgi:hypothetical protein